MGLDKFQICFDNAQAVFYAGQNVTGTLVVVNSTPKKVRGINIKFKGEAEVRWEERTKNTTNTNVYHAGARRRSGPNDTVIETYHNHEEYFNTMVTLFSGGSEQMLEPGEHSYRFNCLLPQNIPSSFEGAHGYVRYSVRAVVDRPWKFDHETKATISVVCPLDLNANPQNAHPKTKEYTKNLCCCCCASGPVNIVLSLPTGGGVPGETLLPSLEIENTSRANFRKISLKLIKIVTYIAVGGRTKRCELSIAEKNLGALSSGQSHTFEREPLVIPSLPPSNLTNCKCIDVDYYLEAHFTPSAMFYCNFQIMMPIVIGTIPLYQNFAQYTPAVQNPPIGWNFIPSAPVDPYTQVDPSAPVYPPSAPLDDGLPRYPDLPPPSYEDSMFGAQSVVEPGDNQYIYGEKLFAPKYPVYRPN